MDGSTAAWGVALALCIGACGPQLTWTRTAPSSARSSGCSFDVLEAVSSRPATVIGVIDIDAFSVRAIPKNDAELRRSISKRVCRVGGDAVVAGVNGDGRYVLATVLKYVGSGLASDSSSNPETPQVDFAERADAVIKDAVAIEETDKW